MTMLTADSLPSQVPALVRAGYRVIAPDLRGFGSTDKPQVLPVDFTARLCAVCTWVMVLQSAVLSSAALMKLVRHAWPGMCARTCTHRNIQLCAPP